MSNYQFKLPDVGEGIAEAEIVAWHVAVGDRIGEDDPLADVMTDKATVEISSPVSGIVVTLNGTVGDLIPTGSVLAVLDRDDADDRIETEVTAAAEASVSSASSPGRSGPDDGVASRTPAPAAAQSVPMEEEEQKVEVSPGRAVRASPAVRQRAKALSIELADVEAGPDGRIRHSHLDAFLSYNAGKGYALPGKRRGDEAIKIVGLRRRIAENMVAAKRAIPHFSYVEEIDVTKLEILRADLNKSRGNRPKLTLLPLLVTAICKAIPDYPMMNARFDDEAGIVTRFGAVHLGIATQTDAGLMVPVVRNAQDRNIWQLAREIARLAETARAGKVEPGELSGSTITITSLGPLGGIATTPVINRPEVAILGPNKIVERLVVRDGDIAVAKLMNLSISCDHRVVDGWDAASFVQELRRFLETPALLFAP